ncbi:hypothetical protein [Bacillus multifaciens]|uniref:hypothetical protein n=1 Tax=Bacillus multifaciens TaxID=3068506 RepID=UPI002740436E|nr:hypothetical protein [Bacillus sp. WLY-B-L8]MDP7979914.1 hypothetical protein [Bacillus sp. WLY-B-L8]
MRQADLVKIISKEYGSEISQKVVKERIDKIYKFIKAQFISNKKEFDTNESTFFEICIRNIERKNFHQYTGAIFLSLLFLYKSNEIFQSVLKGNIVDDDYLEDFITYFEEYMDGSIGTISNSNKYRKKIIYLAESEKKKWENYEEDFPYFRFILKGFIKKIFESKNIINAKIIDEMRYTSSLLKKADKLSTYKHYLFIKKLNRKIELLLKKEKSTLKEELRDAIIKHDLDAMECIVANLNFYPDLIEDHRRDIKLLEDLESVLWSRYKLNSKAMFQIGDFKNKILKYEVRERMEIIQQLQEIVNLKGKREVFSFIEKINSEDDKKVERKKEKLHEEYKVTKKSFLRAWRLKSKTEMHRILKERIEYTHLENSDKQLHNAIEKLMEKALEEKNSELLLKINNILKYYKKFFM